MSPTNFERMIALATEIFDARNDPEQISVTDEDMERLQALHSATMMQEGDDGGPVAWVLVFPTTRDLMEQFIRQEITEHALLWKTPVGEKYDAIYLCSALVLPEYRGKGIAKDLTVSAVHSIQQDHHITDLFFWPFSNEGAHLAESVARETHLPLSERPA